MNLTSILVSTRNQSRIRDRQRPLGSILIEANPDDLGSEISVEGRGPSSSTGEPISDCFHKHDPSRGTRKTALGG